LYLQLLVDSDIHLPVFRSADLHRWTTITTPRLREITGGQNALLSPVNHDRADALLPFRARPPSAALHMPTTVSLTGRGGG
jgi:hypothetical protein